MSNRSDFEAMRVDGGGNAARMFQALFCILLASGCQDQSIEVHRIAPLSTYESDWSSMASGAMKTHGPIQFRYRLEEYDGRSFKLDAFARTAIKGVGPITFDLMSDLPKTALVESKSLQKPFSEAGYASAERRFEFSDPQNYMDQVTVRIEIVLGNQVARKTFNVSLGPIPKSRVKHCSPPLQGCEQELPATIKKAELN